MTNNSLKNLRELFAVSADGKRCEFLKQLDRDVYKRIADAFSRIEGRWSRKDNAFVFPVDVTAEIERIFSTGKLPERNPLQLFPTPRHQVLDMLASSDNAQRILRRASGEPNETAYPVRMLEPSIGLCGIADVVKELYPSIEIVGVELDSVNAKLAVEKGYNVTHADFLTYPIPATEADRFDIVIMNPPFFGREFIKHIRHAQAMLKHDGVLISVIPHAWMANAIKENECQFLDEITRTSSMIQEPYPAGTYEKTDCVTCIIELMHVEKYANFVAEHKSYWINTNVIELENDADFRAKFDSLSAASKMNFLRRELTKKRNKYGSPSVIEWADEVLVSLIDENEPNFDAIIHAALSSCSHGKTNEIAVENHVESLGHTADVQPEPKKELNMNSMMLSVAKQTTAEQRLPKILKPFVLKVQRHHINH